MRMRATGVTIDLATKRGLIQKVEQQGEFIRFEEQPALASLCTSLGLQFEMGNPDFDRLSPFFGVTVTEGGESPWCSQILSAEGEIGVQFWRRDGAPLHLRHRDLCWIIDSDSFDEKGTLTRIVIYPGRVARNFRNKGFDLVVVRDWMLTSSLNLEEGSRVSYLLANDWEITHNIARTQAKMMENHQLAFSGTHDISDHLLNADVERFCQLDGLFSEVRSTFDRVFSQDPSPSNSRLILSYFIGVLLDDLAQPRWYADPKHEHLTRAALKVLAEMPPGGDLPMALPDSFHALVGELRSPVDVSPLVSRRFFSFVGDLTSMSAPASLNTAGLHREK